MTSMQRRPEVVAAGLSLRVPRAPWSIILLVAVLVLPAAAHAATARWVSAACGGCHGLTVNGVVVAPGPGVLNFTATVRDRNQAAWAGTIARMVSNGATVADVNGTAAYLAALGAMPAPTPTATALRTPTAT